MEIREGKGLGLACAVSSSAIWGFTILYWKALVPIDSLAIMLYRILFVGITMLIVNLKIYNRAELTEVLKSKENIRSYIVGGILISASWGINIWGVNVNEILQISLGFYLEPLFISAIGLFVFRERATKLMLLSFLFALIGVVGMMVSYGRVPMFALGLAGTYAAYAVVKRNSKSPVFIALFYESAFLIPIALPAVFLLERAGRGVLAQGDPNQMILLLFIGAVTTVPLGLFGIAARRVDFTVLGITVYLDPTISLMLGIFLYREEVDIYKAIGFITIWIGILFFTINQLKGKREKE